MEKVKTIKSSMIRSGLPAFKEYMDICVNGSEYFVLSKQTWCLLRDFVDNDGNNGVTYTSIEDIKIPYNHFCLDHVFFPKTEEKPPLNKAVMKQNLVCMLKDEESNQLLMTQCTKYADSFHTYHLMYPYTYCLKDFDRSKQYEFLIYPHGQIQTYESYLKGDKYTDQDPVFGVNFAIWSKDYYDYFEKEANREQLMEQCFGLPFASFALRIAMAFCLIRTGVNKQKVERPVIATRKRGKKKSRPRKQSFTVVTLDSVETYSESTGAIEPRQGVSAHTVRGHFKKKKNGIFWWNPFVRGSGPRTEREAYLVKE